MKKTVWITMLEHNEGLARLLFQEMSRYGLEPGGHFWEDDLTHMTWSAPLEEMRKDTCGCWIIAGPANRLAETATRQGLSYLALAVQAVHGPGFPILLSPSAGGIDPATLPTPLRGAEVVSVGLGPKAVAKAHAIRPKTPQEYRLCPHPLPGVGFWLEIGPGQDPWSGVFLGARPAAPDAHGVGPAGAIPQTSTLHYPVRGMKLTRGDTEFEAWGVKNELTLADSYFVRLPSPPEALVFGPFPNEDTVDVFTVTLA